MQERITYVGIDAHKEVHQVAMVVEEVEMEKKEEVVEWTVRNTLAEVRRMAKRIKRRAPGHVVACYEAGACGFALQRQLEAEGIRCLVVAPSLIPVKPGNRVKTDSRDARQLLQFLKAGLLTEVAAPTPEEEDLRDLCRCRETVKKHLMAARHQLLKFLTRRGITYGPGSHWTRKHHKWLRSLKFERRNASSAFSHYLAEVERLEDLTEGLDRELEEVSQEEPYREIVGYLRCFRGIDTVSAVAIVAEVFGIMRFASARELMSYLGLTPSLYRSAGTERRGGITKAGNKYARRVFIESAWHYRLVPRVSKALKSRRRNQPQWVIDLADQAMRRLHKRHRHLVANGKKSTVATTAVARELVGFIWSVLYTQAAAKLDQSGTGQKEILLANGRRTTAA